MITPPLGTDQKYERTTSMDDATLPVAAVEGLDVA